jgi:Domain of unknown function (DUF4232)
MTAQLYSKRALAAGALLCAVALVPVTNASGRQTVRSAAPSCKTSGLVVWLDTQGDAAAGSVFYKLKFTNLSGSTCVLRGYPGVSAVNLKSHQLGRAASRTQSPVRVISLRTGATASAELRIVAAANFPAAACHQVAAAGVRVFPPNQTAAKIVPLPFEACARSGPIYLNVKAVAA